MFPNDDICNIKAARDAAKRIFNRYKEPTQVQSNSSGLGEKQVSNLIKNAYQAINITYDPSMNDVSSFMSVFGVGQDGKIDLGKIQEMAVKYLCGEDSMNQTKEKNQDKYIQAKNQTKGTVQSLSLSKQNMSQSKMNQSSPLSFKTNGKKSPQLHQNNTNLLSPKASQIKYQFVLKQNVKTQTQDLDGQKVVRPSFQDIMKKANDIFCLNKNRDAGGITVRQAAKILVKTYELIGKQNYNPTEDDVKIWMKLCDSKKTGVIDWMDYQNFVKRLLERENIRQQH